MRDGEKREVGLWAFIGFWVTALLGTVLHFLYDWTGSAVVALFSAVNESTWEHMKLAFFPMFVFAIVQWFIAGRQFPGYWCIKMRSIVAGLVLIPVLFYTLGGVFGATPGWVNIAIFFAAVAIAYLWEARQFKKGATCTCNKWAFALLCLIAVLFFVFTFATPRIALFEDPISGTYGIQ